MRSRQSHDKHGVSSSLPPSLQRATDASAEPSATVIPPSGLNASFARTPALSLQRAPTHSPATPTFGGQLDLSLSAPPRPANLAPTIQRQVDDPDGAIRKKFVAAAKKAGFNSYDVRNANKKLTAILKKNDTESAAWTEWVEYWQDNAGLIFKQPQVIALAMKKAKENQEKLDKEIGELAFDEPIGEKSNEGKQTTWDDEEPIDWDKESFNEPEFDYEKQLDSLYPQIQDIAERTLWQMYEEEGYLQSAPPIETEVTGEEGKKEKEEKKEPSEEMDFSFTETGQKTLNKAMVKSQKGESLDISRLEQSFIFNHFKCPTSGSIKTRSNPEREHTTLNYQGNRDLKSQGIPGIGTYDNHLGRLSEKANEGGLELKDLFQDMEGSNEERVKRMKKRVSLKLPKLSEKKWEEISATLVKEEDKTQGLNQLEQDRSYRDCLATATSFDGIGSLWPPTMGLKTLNPMYHEGATTVAIKEQKGEELTKDEMNLRGKTVSVGKNALKELITKTLDEKFKPAFQRREGLFRRSKSLKKFLKDPKNKEAELEIENEVRRVYSGKRKRTPSNPGAQPEDPKKKKEDND